MNKIKQVTLYGKVFSIFYETKGSRVRPSMSSDSPPFQRSSGRLYRRNQRIAPTQPKSMQMNPTVQSRQDSAPPLPVVTELHAANSPHLSSADTHQQTSTLSPHQQNPAPPPARCNCNPCSHQLEFKRSRYPSTSVYITLPSTRSSCSHSYFTCI